MTIDEAITDLSIQLQVKNTLGFSQQAEAIRLGIEALKLYRVLKQESLLKPPLLSGETEE